MEIRDKLIFLRYCAPCVDDFVMQGLMTKDYANEILNATKRGEVLPGSEKYFDFAYLTCERIAKRLGKDCIDAEVIRTYYLKHHNNIVKIHKPIACSVEECKINISKEIDGLKTCFFNKDELKTNEIIIVHRGYVVDLLTKEELEEVLSKSLYLETH
ncbi:MAG: hypothetical protein J7K22_00750 [Nanoarchaeota archaeon]|nr:hypothetical protein [Nanoarchaeota archaeon]